MTETKPRFNFRLYATAVQMVATLAPIADDIRRRSRDLADQMERALASVPLNVAEGAESAGSSASPGSGRRWGRSTRSSPAATSARRSGTSP